MGHSHKFSQCWSSQDGMVRRFEVGYFELDVLCPEVLLYAECNRKGNRANWCIGISWNDAIERSLAWCEQAHVIEDHLHLCACEDQIKPTSTIDKYSSKFGSLDDWNEY